MRIKVSKGRSESSECALIRPFNRLFHTGKHIGSVNWVLFKGNDWPLRILGSLVYTHGRSRKERRILFFPGLIERKTAWLYSTTKKYEKLNWSSPIDHITLESNFSRWHFSMLDSDRRKKIRLPTYKTMKNKDATFWFGLSMKNSKVLEIAPEAVKIEYDYPSSDADRIFNLFNQSLKNYQPHIAHLSELCKPLSSNEFLHFDFFIGKETLGPGSFWLSVPKKNPIVNGYESGDPNIRGCPVSLEDFDKKIWIIVSKHRGQLRDKAIITCY